MRRRIVGRTSATLGVLAGALFAIVGWSFFAVGEFEYGGLAVAVGCLAFGAVLLVRSAMLGAVRVERGVKVRNFERSHTVDKRVTVRKDSYYHGASPFLFTSPVVTFGDGRELQLTGLKQFAFIDRWTHTTDRNVAKVAEWLRPDEPGDRP